MSRSWAYWLDVVGFVGFGKRAGQVGEAGLGLCGGVGSGMGDWGGGLRGGSGDWEAG